MCVWSTQDVPVPIVQVIPVDAPFLRTVTTPEEAFTPPAVAVTIKSFRFPLVVLGTGAPIAIPASNVVLVQVVGMPVPVVDVPLIRKPRVEDAVATPVQTPCTDFHGWKLDDGKLLLKLMMFWPAPAETLLGPVSISVPLELMLMH